MSRLLLVCMALVGAATAATAQNPPVPSPAPLPAVESPPILTPAEVAPPAPPPPSDPLLFQNGPIRVKLGFDATVQPTGEIDSWWLLSKRFAPDSSYAPDLFWTEGWFKPSMRTDWTISDRMAAYSGVSYVGSGTVGKDVFDQGYMGLLSVEDAYLGLRYGDVEAKRTMDLSYGRQPYKIGSGMLISVGALNGFERGAVTTFARRAWEETAMAKLNWGALSFDTFYLKPNELRTADTNTQLAGSKAEVALGANQYIGLAFLNVFASTLPYLAAPLRLIPNGRDGLTTLHTYTRVNPLKDNLPGLYAAGDFAYQWNDRIDMRAFAYSAEIGNTFGNMRLKPTLAYAFRYFSGDNPATATYEKFDPLFYEGSPALWSSGSNGSLAFLNSNVLTHRVSLGLTVTPRDFINFYYWHVRAAQVNSPLQFGQSSRVEISGGEPRLFLGVPDAHLSDDFYTDYTRAITQNIYLTTGFGVSIPGRGLREISGTATWFGGLMNLTVKY